MIESPRTMEFDEVARHNSRSKSAQAESGGVRRRKEPVGQSQLAFLSVCLLLYTGFTFPVDVRMIRNLLLPSSYEDMFPSPKRQISFIAGKKNDSLQIAWIMSFPNSGTSFTIKQIRYLGMTQSGTNYGHENTQNSSGESVQVFGDQAGGPFWMDPDLHPEFRFPKRYVLVKTHCGGRCQTCPPQRYFESTYSFRQECLTGKRRWIVNGTKVDERVSYPMDRVKKAIHLIRDPFDNIVSRFHMETKGRSAEGYNKTREDFRRYCFWLNDEYEEDERNNRIWFHFNLLQIMQNVPCRADFFRYIEWHNQAFALTQDANLQTLVVHYEEYTKEMDEVSARLLKFLDLKPDGTNFEFYAGKFYRDFFDIEERRAVHDAFQIMASRQTWFHIEAYFYEK